MDRSGATVQELTEHCISTLTELLSKDLAIQDRLADLKLWADSVDAQAPSGASLDSRLEDSKDKFTLVKSVLSMLVESLKLFATLRGPKSNGWDLAVSNVDSGISDLILISNAIRQDWRWPDSIDAGSDERRGGLLGTPRRGIYQWNNTSSAEDDTHEDAFGVNKLVPGEAPTIE